MHTFDQGNGYWKRKDLYFIYFNKSILETSSEFVNLDGSNEVVFSDELKSGICFQMLRFQSLHTFDQGAHYWNRKAKSKIFFNTSFLETSPELQSLLFSAV